jgi:signal transduction histidine kinase
VGNARKYGGPHIAITTRTCDRRVEILVEDDGPGVPDGFVHQLFERYSRSHEARTGGQRGSGLGLYIVRDLLTANHGTIDYEGSSLGGAAFRLSLPAA